MEANTYLSPYHLRKCADELRRSIGAELEGFLIDYLAD